ncbi:MAG: phytanoyl-CoA dioxygenase family protein, partial [Gammaproteobacteria bacterium]|nr:phytanoyl-CoA dioxygenase family protein [Gammaproteobacteria bacterium]
MTVETNASNSGPPPVVPSDQTVIERLREENAQLRRELQDLRGSVRDTAVSSSWKEQMAAGIGYSDGRSDTSAKGAWHILKQLSGIAKERVQTGKIRNSTVFPYLPTASSDQQKLEADFIRWGYCVVKDAMSPKQVQDQIDRLTEQAAAERKLNKSIMTSGGQRAQLVNNLVLKGQIFRDTVEFKESAAQGGPLVDALLTKVMGEGFGLGCAHGSIVHEGGGLQDLHIDQGGIPHPYPPFPFGSLIIWCFTDFNLENGATYVVPGSHRTADGKSIFDENANLLEFIDGEPGLVAICAPPGSCILTDTRVLHGGGQRT